MSDDVIRILLFGFNMGSLIANQVKKTNICFVSVKLFLVLITFVPLFTLNWYSMNYNNNCPAHNCNCFVHTQLHTRLIKFLLTVARFVLPLYIRTHSVCRTFSMYKFAFLPSRELYRDRLYMCIFILVYPSCLLLLDYLKGVRCICVLCTHCHLLRLLPLFALSISFTLMIVVLVVFV